MKKLLEIAFIFKIKQITKINNPKVNSHSMNENIIYKDRS